MAPGWLGDLLGMKTYPVIIPIGSMYGIFTYIYHKNQPDVAKYAIRGSCGIGIIIIHEIRIPINQPGFNGK